MVKHSADLNMPDSASNEDIRRTGRIIYLPVVLLGLALFCAPQTRWIVAEELLSWSDAFSIAALLSFFLIGSLQGRRLFIPVSLMVVALCYLLSAAIHYLQYLEPFDVVECAKLVFAAIIFPIGVGWIFCLGHGFRVWLIACWVLGAMFSAAVASTTSMGIDLSGLGQSFEQTGRRAMGLTYHPNSLAYICSLVLPFAAYLIAIRRSFPVSAIGWVALVTLGYAIYLSGSRISIAAAPIGLFIFLVWAAPRHARAVRFILFTGLFLLLAITLYLVGSTMGLIAEGQSNAIARFLNFGSGDVSVSYRVQKLQEAYVDFVRSPIHGRGFIYIRYAHNSFVQVLHAGGIIASIGFVLWHFVLFLMTWRVNRWNAKGILQSRENLLFAAIISSVIVWLLSGLTHNFITDRNGYFPIGLLVGMYMTSKLRALKTTRQDEVFSELPFLNKNK